MKFGTNLLLAAAVLFVQAGSAALAAGSGSVVADFNSLTQNKAPPAGYPVAGFAWSNFWVTAPNDSPAFATQSLSTTSASSTTGSVTLASGYTLTGFDASNGGNAPATVTVTCANNPQVKVTLGVGQSQTITTNWQNACSVAKFQMSNAWATDLDNLAFATVGSTLAQPPVITSLAGPANCTSGSCANQVTFAATDSSGGAISYICSVNTAAGTACNSPFTIPASYLTNGGSAPATVTVSVVATDTSNNTSAAKSLSFTVSPVVATGSALLSWTAPNTNTDGTSLTDLAGFNIYCSTANPPTTKCGTVAGSTDGATVSFTVPNLASGTWYFDVTAFNSTGVESSLSSIMAKTIP